MDARNIKAFLDIIGAEHVYGEDDCEWVQCSCPLAFKHPAHWKNGQPGKDSRPSFGISVKEKGMSICNCFAAGTEVITGDGVRLIEDLAGSSVDILTEGGVWAPAKFSSFGKHRLWELVLSRNGVVKTIYTTKEHRWFVHRKKYGNYVEITTDNLRAGTVLEPCLPKPVRVEALDPQGVRHGIMFGDGSRKRGTDYGRVVLFGGKRELVAWFAGVASIAEKPKGKCGGYSTACGYGLGEFKTLPSKDAPLPYLMGFLAGLLATDGCVPVSQDITISSAKREVLEWVRDVSTKLGITTFPIKSQLRLGYGVTESWMYTIPFLTSTIPLKMFIRSDQLSRREAYSKKYERIRWSVISVKTTNIVEEVYCAQVPQYGSFTLDGNILTGNCFACQFKGSLGTLVTALSFMHGKDLTEARQFISGKEDLSVDPYESKKTVGLFKMPRLAPGTLSGFPSLTDKHSYLRFRGIGQPAIDRFKLRYDRAEKRILIPIFDQDRRLVGIRGRSTLPDPKIKMREYSELSTSEKSLKRSGVWFGMNFPLQDETKRVIVVEGELGCISLWQATQRDGIIASMGATLTDAQMYYLQSLKNPIVLFFDDDPAGRLATEKLIRKLKRVKMGGLYKVRDYSGCNDPEDVVNAGRLKKAFASIESV